MKACRLLLLLLLALASGEALGQRQAATTCGEVLTLRVADGATIGVSLSLPRSASGTAPVTLMLLPGGSGNVELDAGGCARALKGNSLVRSIPVFNALGFATALVDAPSTFKGEEGLGGHRATPEHARDLAAVAAMLRERLRGAVWVVGTSRGTISAANLASRAAGAGAPDGVVLTSIVTVGDPRARRPWVAQSVFDFRLEAIAAPVLMIGHADDACVRSPAAQMERVARRLTTSRQQVVVVNGGPGGKGLSAAEHCEGRSPHGFVDQEREVADGIARFVRGGRY